jgi:hypothetical protein
VILLDAVGFSLLSPLEQVVQLNSLSCSVNAAYAKLLDREININFARTTTGDGFYIWNRMRGMAGNVELYQLMQFILADNALARERAVDKSGVPSLRACFPRRLALRVLPIRGPEPDLVQLPGRPGDDRAGAHDRMLHCRGRSWSASSGR